VRAGLASGLRAVWRAAVADKVSSGRLRNVDWPYGLGAVVALAMFLGVAAAVLALVSGPLRGQSDLVVPGTLHNSTPSGLVWLLTFLVVAAVAIFSVAALHGPWWLKLLGFGTGAVFVAMWGVTGGIGLRGGPILAGGLILLLLALWIWRGRRPFAWWEFPVVLAIYGVGIGVTVGSLSVNARDFGFEFTPVLLSQMAGTLAFLVLPAALVAGASVAEITVALTVAAARQAQGFTERRWPYVLLGLLVCLRVVQLTWQVVSADPVEEGWLAILPAIGMAAALGGVTWLLVRISDRPAELRVAELPDEMLRIGIPVGVAVVCVLIPVSAFLFGYQILFGLSREAAQAINFDPSPVVDRLVDGFRTVLGLILVGISLWLARRRRLGVAVVLGCSGVMLVALGMRLLTGYQWALWIDPDSLNLVATVTVLVLLGWHLVRRTLSQQRAIAMAGLLILSALFSYRDFVSDPVGAVLGYSGVALVLFGVTWDFLTGSDWANGESRRFPRPVRVLLAITYAVLTVTILAYGSLVRAATSYANLDDFAELGDLILGTALLAAAFTTVLRTVRTEQVIE
jgi:hypothetical protein